MLSVDGGHFVDQNKEWLGTLWRHSNPLDLNEGIILECSSTVKLGVEA